MPYRPPTEDDEAFTKSIITMVFQLAAETKSYLRAYTDSLCLPATAVGPVACQLYWSFNDIEPDLIQAALGLDAKDFWRIVRPGWVVTGCASCHKRCVPVLCDSRGHRDDLVCQNLLCPNCLVAADRRETDEHHRKIEADRLTKQHKAEREAEAARLRAMPYAEYLASPEWKARRDAIVERDGGACRVCSSTDHLNVHHRTYERRGDEAPGDLITLCQPCHQLFHDNAKLANAGG